MVDRFLHVLFGLFFGLACGGVVASAQTTRATPPARPASVDPALWGRMLRMDESAAKVADLTARFEQRKVTPMLKKPLVSGGTVRVLGSTMRWDTEKPAPSVIFADEKDFKLYYPAQKLVETYPVDRRLASLAASPLPRLDVLVGHFDFVGIDVTSVDPEAKPDEAIALRLSPTSPLLKDHVEQVRVLLDIRTGLFRVFELTDTDGDTTTIRFSDVRENTGLKASDLTLQIPAGVTVSRPLDGLGDPPPKR